MNQDLKRTLWAAADKLRSSMDAAEYKHIVLGLIFVKYMRARGVCELCGTEGFRTAAGQVYLETHHVAPLSEGGLDQVSNVVALCPNDHRRAHHGSDRSDIRSRLTDMARRSTAAT